MKYRRCFTPYLDFVMLSPMIALWSLGLGCVQGAIPAPYSARLTGLQDSTITWSADWNDEFDQQGAIVSGSLMVYDSETDMPLEHIEVEITSNWQGAYLIPSEAVQLVGYPEASVDPTDEDAIRQACTDANGNFQSDPEWCAWYWDTESQQFYQVGGQYISTSSNYAPNLMYGRTNNRGLMDFYIYVDAMPRLGGNEQDTSFGSITFGASIGVDNTSWAIRTGGGE